MGLFSKKRIYADLVIHNANIYTNDFGLPYAEAVACTDGKIIAVGNFDAMEDFIGKETEVIDLEGKFLYPGFIDCHRSVVASALKDVDLADEENNSEDYLSYDNPEDDNIEVHTFDESKEDENEYDDSNGDFHENIMADENESDDSDGDFSGDFDTDLPDGIIEEELLPEVREAFDRRVEYLMDNGFTTVLDLASLSQAEDTFINYLLEKYNEDETKLRFFGALYVNIPVHPEVLRYVLMQRKTNMMETDDTLNAEHVYIEINNESSETKFTENNLFPMLEVASERGFIVYIDAASYDDLKLTYDGLEYIRTKGYKNRYIIASDEVLSDEDKSNSIYWEDAVKTWGTDPLSRSSIYGKDVHGMEARIEQLTTVAAQILGMEDELGSIEVGKYADFVVYQDDLFNEDSANCSKLHAQMTFLKGRLVYDLQNEIDDEMMDMMMGMHM